MKISFHFIYDVKIEGISFSIKFKIKVNLNMIGNYNNLYLLLVISIVKMMKIDLNSMFSLEEEHEVYLFIF